LIRLDPELEDIIPMEARAQKTSDSNSNLALTELKTARASGAISSNWKSSPMINKMSRSLGTAFAVTKLPQTKTRRSRPFMEARSTSLRRRPP